MAKYAIECPKCATVNTASTFILAKKVIKCGYCGNEIDTKALRMASRVCPHCEKVYVYDQSKGQYSKCPSCGTTVDNSAKNNDGMKVITVNCPQCACACTLKVGDSQETAECPVCSYEFDIKRELSKAKLVTDNGVSVIQYEGDNSTFVWKHPIEDFNLGSQLIVHENQEAIFYLNGEALDTFGPGRHTLETENLPVLKRIYSVPTGHQTPFHAEVYFINQTVQMSLKWGTAERIRFIDPVTGIPLDIGANGELNLRVANSRILVTELVGTMNGISWEAGPSEFAMSLKDAFRPMLLTEIKNYLATVIKERHINIFEIDSYLSEISEALRERISPKFETYGLTVPQFWLNNISLPEDDKNFKDIRSLISDAYIGVRTQEVRSDIALAEQRRKIIEAQTEAQLKAIAAQAEAQQIKLTGMAEAEVMHAKGYSEKDVLEAGVQKAYAEGLGNMGPDTVSGGGNFDIVGMMAQMKMAGMAFDKMGGVFDKGMDETFGTNPPAATGWTCACGESGNTKNFCMNCGAKKPDAGGAWSCPVCGEKDNIKNFCMNCGAKKPDGNA